MSGRKKPSKRLTASELMAQLAEDEDDERKMSGSERGRHARVQELQRAEQAVVADLRSAGVQVDSVWDLANSSVPYPQGLRVLLRHLQRGGYLDRVMESLGRALAVGPASVCLGDAARTLHTRIARVVGTGKLSWKISEWSRLRADPEPTMARMERTLTARVGCPLNLEPWAGTEYGNHMELIKAILDGMGG